MKICILGLDGANPQLLFADERLANIRRLMELGTYGELQGVMPSGAILGWTCLAASQDPGSLGLYGLRNRIDCSYSLAPATPPTIHGPAIWDQVVVDGSKFKIFADLPNIPPRLIAGISIGCLLTPDPAEVDFVRPASLIQYIQSHFNDYHPEIITSNLTKEDQRDQISQMRRK